MKITEIDWLEDYFSPMALATVFSLCTEQWRWFNTHLRYYANYSVLYIICLSSGATKATIVPWKTGEHCDGFLVVGVIMVQVR